MMKYHFIVIISVVFLFSNFYVIAEPISKIAFGSCLHQSKQQSIWQAILANNPDIFIFAGDNIYADTTNPDVIKKQYEKFSKVAGYEQIKRSASIYAIWDDHDYGQNDAGHENPIKQQSEQIFLDFFQVPDNSPARSRPGVYQSYYFGEQPQRVQLILLDTRYFRGTPVINKPSKSCPDFNYGKQYDPHQSVLGEAQWEWLASEFEQQAQLRIIVSSIQIIPDQHCWEKWSNFPLEREKLFNLIADKKADNVIFISGDRHLAEVSRLEHNNINYPLYEITSSGMNTKMYGEGEKNPHRMSTDNIRYNNFGLLEINWQHSKPTLLIKIVKSTGEYLFVHEVSLNDLTAE